VIAGILVIALFLSQFKKLHPMLKLVLVGAMIGGPMALILKQPDFGMTMVWVPIVMAMLFVGGVPKRYLIVITLIGLAALPLAINFVLKPYQRDRIVSFLDPEIDPKGTSWAINQSLIAIGSGGFLGKGFKAPNTQVEQGSSPARRSTRITSTQPLRSSGAFIGGVVLLSVFAVLLLSMLFTAYHASDEMGLLITIGFAAQIFFHVYQNVGHDYRADADHRFAAAADQLRRHVHRHDHVRPRAGEQRLGASQDAALSAVIRRKRSADHQILVVFTLRK
jgi:rod shape determining protein RodA